MSSPFEVLLQEFATSKGMEMDATSFGLEFECEDVQVFVLQHPLHEDRVLCEVRVAALDEEPGAAVLSLLLQINEAARFEHDWTIVMDGDLEVSLTTTAFLQGMNVAGLEALMLDGVLKVHSVSPVSISNAANSPLAPEFGCMLTAGRKVIADSAEQIARLLLDGEAARLIRRRQTVEELLALARKQGLTVRALIRELAGGGGHRVLVGTPEQIADEIEHWFRHGAADGFNLMPDALPGGLQDFVDGVVPILQRRGIFRTDYAGRTLREHFGLARPASQAETRAAA